MDIFIIVLLITIIIIMLSIIAYKNANNFFIYVQNKYHQKSITTKSNLLFYETGNIEVIF